MKLSIAVSVFPPISLISTRLSCLWRTYVRELPNRLKLPAFVPKLRFTNGVAEGKSLVEAVRVPTLNHKELLAGGTPLFQFAAVDQLLFVPPPVHRPGCCGG